MLWCLGRYWFSRCFNQLIEIQLPYLIIAIPIGVVIFSRRWLVNTFRSCCSAPKMGSSHYPCTHFGCVSVSASLYTSGGFDQSSSSAAQSLC
jgi:hypothetical protein